MISHSREASLMSRRRGGYNEIIADEVGRNKPDGAGETISA